MVRVMPAAIAIEVTSEQQRELQRVVTAKTSSQRDVFRARIILGLAEGLSHEEISREQGVSLLASISTRPIVPSCSVAMRSASVRPSSAVSPVCP